MEVPRNDADPAALVRRFLALMESRDLEAARSLTGAEFRMVFPGGATMTTLEELVAWAAPRYRRVAKTYERFDVMGGDAGFVVYCSGTLQGAWPDGVAFSGIRFVDRFEIANGRIVAQEVWNDLGEARRQA